MFDVEVMRNGALQLTADEAVIGWISDQLDSGRDSDSILMDGMEMHWANGSFMPFDAGLANPFVGLTSAPCIAESMDIDELGGREVRGRMWFFARYMLVDPIDALMKEGRVIFSGAN